MGIKYVHLICAALIVALIPSVTSSVERNSAQVLDNPLYIWQRDVMIAETVEQISETMKCLMDKYNPEIEGKIKQAWSGNLQGVQNVDLSKINTNQMMDMVYNLANLVLKKLQSSHEQCSKIPYHFNDHHRGDYSRIPKDVRDLQSNLEEMGAIMKCLLSNGKVEPRIHEIVGNGIGKYHEKHSDSMTPEEITAVETGGILKQLRQLNAKCQSRDSSKGSKSNQENSLKILKRDLLVAEHFSNLGEVVKCLMHVFDLDVGQKIQNAWNRNVEKFQGGIASNITSDQVMDLLIESVVNVHKDLEAIHPQCDSIPYVYDHSDLSHVNLVPAEMRNLQEYVDIFANNMKCILSNGKIEPRIHDIFVQACIRYGQQRDTPLSPVQLTVNEILNLISDLKALGAKCTITCPRL